MTPGINWGTRILVPGRFTHDLWKNPGTSLGIWNSAVYPLVIFQAAEFYTEIGIQALDSTAKI